MKKLLTKISLFAVVLSLMAAMASCDRTISVDAKYTTFTVAKGDIEVVIKANGSFANLSVPLTLKATSTEKITFVKVDEENFVTLGDTIIRTTIRDYTLIDVFPLEYLAVLAEGVDLSELESYTDEQKHELISELIDEYDMVYNTRSTNIVGYNLVLNDTIAIGSVEVNYKIFNFLVDEKNILQVRSDETEELTSDKRVEIYPTSFSKEGDYITGKISYIEETPTTVSGVVYYTVVAFLDRDSEIIPPIEEEEEEDGEEEEDEEDEEEEEEEIRSNDALIKQILPGMTATVDVIVRDTLDRVTKPLIIPLEALLRAPSIPALKGFTYLVIKNGYDNTGLANSLDLKGGKLLTASEYDRAKDYLIPVKVDYTMKDLFYVELLEAKGLEEGDKIMIFNTSAIIATL